MQAQGVGARLTRKEDDRFMRGRGQFVADIRLAGMQDVAFVRSPVAHARLHGVSAPDAVREQVFTAADLVNVKGIRAVSGLKGFKVSEQPILASDKLRFVGEPVALCLAPDARRGRGYCRLGFARFRGFAHRARYVAGASAWRRAAARALGRQ
jgi:CO/xanthine dehydrogenase Mo-binding subunit